MYSQEGLIVSPSPPPPADHQFGQSEVGHEWSVQCHIFEMGVCVCVWGDELHLGHSMSSQRKKNGDPFRFGQNLVFE